MESEKPAERAQRGSVLEAITSPPALRGGGRVNQNLQNILDNYRQELLYQNDELSRVNAELELAKQKYETLYDLAPVGYVIFDLQGYVFSANRTFCKMIGFDRGAVCGKKLSNFIAPQSQDAFYFFLRDLNRDINHKNRMSLSFAGAGSDVATEVHLNHYEDRGVYYIRAAVCDVSEQKKLMRQLDQEKERYRIIAEQTHDILFEYTVATDTMVFSSRYAELTGQEPIVPNFTAFSARKGWIYEPDLPKLYRMMEEVRQKKKSVSCDLRIHRSREDCVWYRVVGTVLFDSGTPVRAVGTITNVDAAIKESETLRRAARTDSLTKLYNKEATQNEIEDFLLGEGSNGTHALMIVDVDNFKYINDHLGHLFGDAVLTEVSIQLLDLTRPGDIVGRIGGDEFMVLLKNCESRKAVELIAERICGAMKRIFAAERVDFDLSGSIGISMYPLQAVAYLDMFRKADAALYRAKKGGKNRFSFYSGCLEQSDPGAALMNRYDEAEPHMKRHYADLLFVTSVIEILFEGKNVDSSIMLVLSMLGNYFKVGQIAVVEDCPELDCGKVTYEWHAQDVKQGVLVRNFPREYLTNYGRVFNQEGLFCCYNLDVLKEEHGGLWRFANDAGVHTVLQCALMDGNQCRGFITLNDFENNRVWKQEDINGFMLISKTIGAYLLKQRTQQRSEHYEKIDMLTRAWNLNHFTAEVESFLARPRRRKSALLYLDIRNFKYYNEVYGYAEGDRILQRFSDVMRRELRGDEMFARVSADQFVALMHLGDMAVFQARVEVLLGRLSALRRTEQENYRITVICGVCTIRPGETKVTTIIDRANIARKSAKISHKSTAAYFDGDLEQRIAREKAIEDAMEDALANGEFYVEFQPKVHLSDNSLAGAEALIRWYSPAMGKMYPDAFIPIVEKNGFIVELDFFVLEQVCQRLSKWKQEGLPDIVVSVNFSRLHVNLKDSLTKVKDIVDRWEVDTKMLEIEITESAFTEDAQALIDFMDRLKALGFGISMDDFGAGYSSLNLLKDLPIDVLKLDRKFFRNEGMAARERIVISNVVCMAQQLGIVIVTEGVETKEQSEFLRGIGCQMAQGYLFAKPMSTADFEALLHKAFSDPSGQDRAK